MTSSDSIDLNKLKPILEQNASGGRGNLLPVLWEAQNTYGYLSEPVVTAIGKALRIPLVDIYGVIEFYTMFYKQPVGHTFIRVCVSPICDQVGSYAILDAVCEHFDVRAGETTQDGMYTIEAVECLGMCDQAPAALVGETPVASLNGDDPGAWAKKPQAAPLGFVGGNPRWLTARCGNIQPTDLEAYKKQAGYQGLQRALEEMDPIEVVEQVTESGLAGRGGAAFPTGLKLKFTAQAGGQVHYVVCNADESEPGTFKDRVLMEGDPFSVLEGMALSGYAIGSEKGYIYIRGEYPRAREILERAIEVARAGGYLGENILGSDFSFDVEIRSGAGAYICGEETALFESIEGKRGFPRLKPPFPTTHGLFGQPTAINNVETLCALAWIIANEPDEYRSLGTEKSPGTKMFCLSGDVKQPGVYEVPFGVPMGELLEMAGGVRGDLQAVLVGGAAGAFAAPDQLDLPMSFEGLWDAGLSLGSGVITAINQDRDIKRFLLSLAHFFAHESCGKCFPCQLGTQRQLEIINRVVKNETSLTDIEALKDVGFTMTNASLCGLGMTAGTAVLSALEKWPRLFHNGSE
ncbi:MAG: NAD(P)H-dependent oxidoreductase subunit E [Anaerolineales bacterium]|jgi:NADH-quinone oxidoreductase subunit F